MTGKFFWFQIENQTLLGKTLKKVDIFIIPVTKDGVKGYVAFYVIGWTTKKTEWYVDYIDFWKQTEVAKKFKALSRQVGNYKTKIETLKCTTTNDDEFNKIEIKLPMDKSDYFRSNIIKIVRDETTFSSHKMIGYFEMQPKIGVSVFKMVKYKGDSLIKSLLKRG